MSLHVHPGGVCPRAGYLPKRRPKQRVPEKWFLVCQFWKFAVEGLLARLRHRAHKALSKRLMLSRRKLLQSAEPICFRVLSKDVRLFSWCFFVGLICVLHLFFPKVI